MAFRVPRRLARWLLGALVVASIGSCGRDGPDAAPSAYDEGGRAHQPIRPALERLPNIVLVVIDTLRADCLSLDETDQGDMPRLAARARRGVAFRQASSAASWTVPALTSLLTGQGPWDHGVTTEAQVRPDVLSLTTLAEILRTNLGYATAAFLGGVGPLTRATLEQGFDTWADDLTLSGVPDIVGPWLAQRSAARPFFLMLHVYDAHDPYGAANHPYPIRPRTGQAEALNALLALGPTPPAAELVRRAVLDEAQREQLFFNPRLQHLKQRYVRWTWDGPRRQPDPELLVELEDAYRKGVRWVDEQLDAALTLLESSGALENTVLILTADHGEAFGEHGMVLHGRRLDDELLRVPLVIWGPPPFDRPLQIGAGVGLTDVVPTLLELLGAPRPRRAHGRSLLPLLGTDLPGRPVEAEEHRTDGAMMGLPRALVGSARTPAWKFVATCDFEARRVHEELFDLSSDPGEQHDLASKSALVTAVPGDPEFVAAVERVRDRVWGAFARAHAGAPPSERAAPVTSRPPLQRVPDPR